MPHLNTYALPDILYCLLSQHYNVYTQVFEEGLCQTIKVFQASFFLKPGISGHLFRQTNLFETVVFTAEVF